MSTERIKNNIVADPDCLLCEVPTDVFLKATSYSFKEILNKTDVLELLKHVRLFGSLTSEKLGLISTKVKFESFKVGEKIIKEGDDGTKLYIIKSGKADITVKGNYIRTLNENEYFGERTLFYKEPRSATCVANGDIELIVLDKEDLKL